MDTLAQNRTLTHLNSDKLTRSRCTVHINYTNLPHTHTHTHTLHPGAGKVGVNVWQFNRVSYCDIIIKDTHTERRVTKLPPCLNLTSGPDHMEKMLRNMGVTMLMPKHGLCKATANVMWLSCRY